MKPSLLAALAGFVFLCAGCQSMNWTAKNKPPKENSVAQNSPTREVPWTRRKKKDQQLDSGEIPQEIAAKFEKSQTKADTPKSATEYVLEGNQAEVARNFPAARQAYESALQLDSVNADAHHRLGILADMRQDYAAAQDHYEAALRQKPHDANLLSDFGYSHQLRGNANQSERHLLMALDLNGQHLQALKNLGSLYASQNRYEDALQTFRRFRPEGEAQQLLAQYFPNGDASGNTPMMAARTVSETRTVPPMPRSNVSPEALKNMSREEILAVMEQMRQEGVRSREQKDLTEYRPNLQESTTEADYARTPPRGNNGLAGAPRTTAWAHDTTTPNPSSSVPPTLHASAQPPDAAWANNPADAVPANSEQPFWNGAALPTRNMTPPNAMPPWNNNAAAHITPGGSTAGSFNSSDNSAAATSPPWLGNDPSAHAGANPPVSANYDPTRDASSAPANTAWNPAALTSQSPYSSGVAPSNEISARQRAYQLGMSAGPGTMFPVLPTDEQPPRTNTPAPSAGPNWGTNTANSYQETRAGWDSPAHGTSPAQWQDAITETAPRSPTDNWNSPSTAPWPGADVASPSPRGTAVMPPEENRLPVIKPGPAWNAGPGGPMPSGAVPAGNFAPRNSRSNVVPAWSEAPVTQTRSGNTTSVQQWPYAPN